MILSATLLPFDPMNQGIVEVQLVLDNGETDSLQMTSGLGVPSKRVLDYCGITLQEFNEDCELPIPESDGSFLKCSESFILGGEYETDLDLQMADIVCYNIGVNAKIDLLITEVNEGKTKFE